MDQLSVEAKIQIESRVQDIVVDLLVWWWYFNVFFIFFFSLTLSLSN